MPELRTRNAKINYSLHLFKMWQKHLMPRRKRSPSVISLFAGGGGSSLGYSMTGFKKLLAVEMDDNAVQTFKMNFAHVPVYHGDIIRLSIKQCIELASLSSELDVLDGSPPCQGFSHAGKRKFNDPRNSLFREFVRLLTGLQPKCFVLENVSGLVKGKMKLIFAEMFVALKCSGYKVSARLLNAMHYNVPQNRQRIIFIGIREDLDVHPTHPKPETYPMAINDLSDFNFLPNKIPMPRFNDRYARLWDEIPVGKSAQFILGTGFNNCVKLNPRKPAPTLPKMQTGRGFATIAHPFKRRALTIEEAKYLSSYPSPFRLYGDYSQQWACIGNSVPPLMMEAIARHIKENILNKGVLS